jgi:hypothetical protein
MKMPSVNQDGSAMIDVLMSFAILGLMTYTTMIGAAQTENQDNHQQQLTSAITLGERIMEELFLEAQGGPDLTPGVHSRIFSFSGAPVVSNGVYTATWTITNDLPISEVSQIKLQVIWLEGGASREISLVNFRS